MTDALTTLPEYRREHIAPRIAAGWIADADGCHIWQGNIDRYGYGRFAFNVAKQKKRETGAHRMAYLALVGDIPEGFVVDHLCRTRSCVNPEHMELVDNRTNIMRGRTALVNRGAFGELIKRKPRKALKTHCKYGHPFEGDNLMTQTKPNGSVLRVCRTCRRAVSRKQEAKRTAARIAAKLNGSRDGYSAPPATL